MVCSICTMKWLICEQDTLRDEGPSGVVLLQVQESLFLFDSARLSVLYVPSGKTRRKIPKLHPLLSNVAALSYSDNGECCQVTSVVSCNMDVKDGTNLEFQSTILNILNMNRIQILVALNLIRMLNDVKMSCRDTPSSRGHGHKPKSESSASWPYVSIFLFSFWLNHENDF